MSGRRLGKNPDTLVLARELAAQVERYKGQLDSLTAELAKVCADNERLRGLVKQTETSNHYNDYRMCPWCGDTSFGERQDAHDADCPAFTAEGSVK